MSGSTTDIIAIVIVATIGLAVWLFLVYYAASHPDWRRTTAETARPEEARAIGPAEVRPTTRSLAHDADDAALKKSA